MLILLLDADPPALGVQYQQQPVVGKHIVVLEGSITKVNTWEYAHPQKQFMHASAMVWTTQGVFIIPRGNTDNRSASHPPRLLGFLSSLIFVWMIYCACSTAFILL
jgi:hypothetical protein